MGWADTISSFHSNGDLLRVDHLYPKDINIDDLTDWDWGILFKQGIKLCLRINFASAEKVNQAVIQVKPGRYFAPSKNAFLFLFETWTGQKHLEPRQ